MRHQILPSDDPEYGIVKVDVAVGRKLWLYEMKHLLSDSEPLKIIENYRWTVLAAMSAYLTKLLLGCFWGKVFMPTSQKE